MKIKELLKNPEKWTKGACARDMRGKPVRVNDPTACCWCLVGAAFMTT